MSDSVPPPVQPTPPAQNPPPPNPTPTRRPHQTTVVQRAAVITMHLYNTANWTTISTRTNLPVQTCRSIWQRAKSRANDPEDLLDLLAVLEDLPRSGRPLVENPKRPREIKVKRAYKKRVSKKDLLKQSEAQAQAQAQLQSQGQPQNQLALPGEGLGQQVMGNGDDVEMVAARALQEPGASTQIDPQIVPPAIGSNSRSSVPIAPAPV